ncbi:hypothetical protein C427_3055 [Paraglaciecola psychrophila 170]|uniref:Uncharacterized protein n=1 Tax=Paraglaciecola psychrophila 170 TaxID=1129794 RepID=K7ATZ4_9ALTE|nr:hypothetical protein C427_3055 [Paraglaciecola psychrophila 170]GAC38695.1 hypothetical protein GPSY_3084 [Paraglaciecola psychrophila 170]
MTTFFHLNASNRLADKASISPDRNKLIGTYAKMHRIGNIKTL